MAVAQLARSPSTARSLARSAQSRPTKTTDGRLRYNRMPSQTEIDEIGVVAITEFELSDKECASLRSELYKINHDGIRRYRTLRENRLLLVWRIR